MYEFGLDGGKPIKKEIPASELSRAKEMHNRIVEAAAENDDTLMEHFFETGTLEESELADGLRKGIAKQQIFPVFCCSALKNMGTGRAVGTCLTVGHGARGSTARCLGPANLKTIHQRLRPLRTNALRSSS